MARFNDAWMDTLLSKNDIVSVVSAYVPLRSKGRRLWGLCPFHNEKTPSFSVNVDKQLYYCFGCGAGGGVVQFVMQMERLVYMEAIELLARRVNMELPDTVDDERLRLERAHKERLYEACRLAARYYNTKLLTDEGEAARRYLAERGLNAAVVQRFGLGYAPDTWDGLKNHLQAEGLTEQELLDAGLVNAKSGRVYDAYRNRVIFPIIGTNARVLGFGARAMGDALPKYINTSDTPIYNKRCNLYALNSVKEEKHADIVVVEGYMDAISLYAAGIRNAAASLGTSLTPQQAKLLKRYASTVYIAYDGDSAGQSATLRGLDVLEAEGLHVRVIVLPEGVDPDDFVRVQGKEAFDALREDALALNAFKLMRMAAQVDLGTEDGRQELAVKGCAHIAKLQPVEQERYFAQLKKYTGYSEETLRAQAARHKGAAREESERVISEPRRRRGRDLTDRQLVEQSLLKAAVQAQAASRGAYNPDELFTHEAYREFYKLLLQAEKPDLALLVNVLEPEQAQAVAFVLTGDEHIAEPNRYMDDCVKRIRDIDVMEEIQRLQVQIADETLPLEDRLARMRQIAELNKRIKP